MAVFGLRLSGLVGEEKMGHEIGVVNLMVARRGAGFRAAPSPTWSRLTQGVIVACADRDDGVALRLGKS